MILNLTEWLSERWEKNRFCKASTVIFRLRFTKCVNNLELTVHLDCMETQSNSQPLMCVYGYRILLYYSMYNTI